MDSSSPILFVSFVFMEESSDCIPSFTSFSNLDLLLFTIRSDWVRGLIRDFAAARPARFKAASPL